MGPVKNTMLYWEGLEYSSMAHDHKQGPNPEFTVLPTSTLPLQLTTGCCCFQVGPVFSQGRGIAHDSRRHSTVRHFLSTNLANHSGFNVIYVAFFDFVLISGVL